MRQHTRGTDEAAVDTSPNDQVSQAVSPRGLARTSALLKTRSALMAADTAMICLVALFALTFRSRIADYAVLPAAFGLERAATIAGPQMILGWLLMLTAVGAHSPQRTGAGTQEYQRVLLASAGASGLAGVMAFLTLFPLSRVFFVSFFCLGTIFVLLGRLVLRRVIHRLHASGHLSSRVLVAGAPRQVDDVVVVLRRESWLGYEVVGALTPGDVASGSTPGGTPVLGHPLAISAALQETPADVIVFAEGALPSADDFRRTAWELESHKVQMVVVPALTDISKQRLGVRPVAGLPLVYVERPQRDLAARVLKRAFDVVGSLLMLLALAPLWMTIAVVIRLTDPGPVIFRQTRVGRNGALFECLKFRSMHVGAEQRTRELGECNDGQGVLFKIKRDPRVTPPGRWLRRYSLDELPQLINVMKGEMSLVGPRPPLPDEVEQYSGDMVKRLRVRPGLTGLWQVSGRSDLSWDDTVRLDLFYADNWSISQDVVILLRTVQVVLTGRGAY